MPHVSPSLRDVGILTFLGGAVAPPLVAFFAAEPALSERERAEGVGNLARRGDFDLLGGSATTTALRLDKDAIVTSNLDFHSPSAGSLGLARRGCKNAPKSLFWNILPVTD